MLIQVISKITWWPSVPLKLIAENPILFGTTRYVKLSIAFINV